MTGMGIHWSCFSLWPLCAPALVGMAIPRGSMETFTEHLDEIFYRMKLEILKQHDHQVTMQKLRLRALLGGMVSERHVLHCCFGNRLTGKLRFALRQKWRVQAG